jgi:hypothetical protein
MLSHEEVISVLKATEANCTLTFAAGFGEGHVAVAFC